MLSTSEYIVFLHVQVIVHIVNNAIDIGLYRLHCNVDNNDASSVIIFIIYVEKI